MILCKEILNPTSSITPKKHYIVIHNELNQHPIIFKNIPLFLDFYIDYFLLEKNKKKKTGKIIFRFGNILKLWIVKKTFDKHIQ